MGRDNAKVLGIAVSALILVFALAAYIAAYFLLSTATYIQFVNYNGGRDVLAKERGYHSEALVLVFKPAAAVESVLTGAEVTTAFDLPNP